VWVTGAGVVSPAGWSLDAAWNAVLNGRACTRRLRWLPTVDLDCRVAGPVPGLKDLLGPESLSFRFGEHAVGEALRLSADAGDATVVMGAAELAEGS
jgi:3-oxoacyl-(acyl-carrier-protein) synthase